MLDLKVHEQPLENTDNDSITVISAVMISYMGIYFLK